MDSLLAYPWLRTLQPGIPGIRARPASPSSQTDVIFTSPFAVGSSIMLNCQSKSSLSCFFAAATTSHPKSLQDSNQHSDQTRPNQKLVSICFYMFLSCSICFNSASSCKSQHNTCTLPGGNRGSTVSSSTSKSCKAEGILIKSTRARMASERRPGWALGMALGMALGVALGMAASIWKGGRLEV